MKVARLYSFEDIRVERMAVPEPGPDDVLMKTRASGICSGDVMPWYIERKAPLVIGHEPAGEVAAAGKNVRSYKVGDRVFVHHHAPCFLCRQCRRGDYVQCDAWKNSSIIPGGMAEYVLIPSHNLEYDTLKLPSGVSFEDAVFIEPVGCVIKSLKRARVKPGDTALVIGLGVMGMLHVVLLKKYGATNIIGADMVPFRLKRAMELGAHHVIDVSKKDKGDLYNQLKSITKEAMAEIVIVGPNSSYALEQGLRCAAPGGTVLMFTPVRPGESITINPNELYFKDISLVPSYSCGPTDTADALDIIKQGVVKAEMLVTHRFKIDEAPEAYRTTASAKDSLKCVVEF